MSVKLIWLLLAIAFGVIEVFTLSLTMIWFSIGCLVALSISFFTDSYILQIGSFLIVSFALLFIATKTLLKMDKSPFGSWRSVGTNIDAVIGKVGYVISDIKPNQYGVVKVKSEEWTACSVNPEEEILAGEKVEVEDIQGVKVVVKKVF